MCVVAKSGRRGMNWEFGISRYKLLYIEWINNKGPTVNTGNDIQCAETNHNGKEIKRMNMYTCVCECKTESLCCDSRN